MTGDQPQPRTPDWLEYFACAGYPDVTPLAAGGQGSVFRLGNETVAKVWIRRQVSELVRLQRFYADVAAHPLPDATPEIMRVMQVGDITVTSNANCPARRCRTGWRSPTASWTQRRSPSSWPSYGHWRGSRPVPP
jgi:hypothetical protein